MSPQIERNVQAAIDDYLDAVGEAFGPTYRDQMTVEAKGQHIMIRHPDAKDGEMIPLGYMPILTRNTRDGWFRKHAA